MQNFYANLKEAKSDSHAMKNECKFSKRCLEVLGNGDLEDGVAKKVLFSWRWS